jgi:3-hydroxyisobutyrate dehydrogenase-like beta-hydroxyacid dehydrogenase
MSTISPATATKLSERSENYQVKYLAAPVLGRPPAAEARQLFILLSGKTEAKEKVQPLLQSISQRVFDYGDNPASANTVKLSMNYMIFVITELLSEVMLVAEKAGIDKAALLDTMTSTVFGAPVFKIYGSLVIQEKDNPNGFATRLASKDLRLMQETAAMHKLVLPMGEIIQKHFKEMIALQGGDKDVSQLITHLRETLKG